MSESKYFPDLKDGTDVASVDPIEDGFTAVEADIDDINSKLLLKSDKTLTYTKKETDSKISSVSKNSYKFMGSVYDLDWIKRLGSPPISTNEIPVYKYIGKKKTITQPYNGTPYIITIQSIIQSQRWDYDISMAVDCTMFEIPEDEGIIFYPGLEFTLQQNKCTVDHILATGNTKDSRKIRIYTKDKLPDDVVKAIKGTVPSTQAFQYCSPEVTLEYGDNFAIIEVAMNAFINKFGNKDINYYIKSETDNLLNDKADKTDLDSMAETLKQKSIPHTTESGYPIKIDDQLADETPLKCNIHGCKNLIPYPYSDTTKTANGITFTDNGDGTITVNGTATTSTQFKMVATSLTDIDTSQKYILSGGLSSVTVYISLYKGTTWKKDIKTNGNGSLVDFPSYTDIEWDRILVLANVPNGYTVNNAVIKPQLEIGTTATDYEPYQLLGDLDSTDQKYKIPLIVYGKNMLDADKFKYYTTEESKKLFTTPIYFKAGKKYTFSFKSATSPKKWRLMMSGTETDGTPLKISEDSSAASAGWYMSGMYTGAEGRIQDSADRATTSNTYTCNKDFICTKIMYWNTTNGASDTFTGAMLEESDTATVYEPYTAPQTITANLDSALQPNEYIDIVNKKRYKGSTITDITVSGDLKLTDSDVNTMLCSTSLAPSRIELSYYQDINKVIEKMTNAILAQGGNV